MELQFMQRALELAARGAGYTNPNPLVGAVLVKEGRIIGEGFHQAYGGPHGEINAIKNATEEVAGADLYVTLEPCAHYGKTPPCVEAIVRQGIGRVFIGIEDPNPLVSGKGIRYLTERGIEVQAGILEEAGKRLNEIFLKYITTGRPFCLMKTAMTLDGKIATVTGDSRWITGETSRQYVHRLRHRMAAVMVGIGTILADDPQLTTRLETGEGKDAARIIVDSTARIPLEAKVLNLDSAAPTLVAVTEKAPEAKLKALEAGGAQILMAPVRGGGVDLAWLMAALGKRKLDSVLLEGGSKLNFAALEAAVVDKVNLFIAPKLVGGELAKTPVGGAGVKKMEEALSLERTEIHVFEPDFMIAGYPQKGGGICLQV